MKVGHRCGDAAVSAQTSRATSALACAVKNLAASVLAKMSAARQRHPTFN